MRRFVVATVTMVSSLAMAATYAGSAHESNAQLQTQLNKISSEVKQLSHEAGAIQAQLNSRKSATSSVAHAAYVKKGATQKTAKKTKKKAHKKDSTHGHGHEHHSLKNEKGLLSYLDHPVTVTTSPVLGFTPAYDGVDFLSDYSSINEDFILLEQRQKLINALAKKGKTLKRPIVELSGTLEGEAFHSNNYRTNDAGISLSTAEIDINAILNKWVNAFFSIEYDDSPSVTGSRVPNSRIYLQRGFFTIGNLNVTPFYLSVGQMYVPFGIYWSYLVTTPVTESLGRVLARTMLLGFHKNGFYASIYAFNGEQRVSGIVKQGGANIGFKKSFGKKNAFDIGGGVISNIADSEGMQDNGLDSTGMFNGFGESSNVTNPMDPSKHFHAENFNNLRHRVPAYNVHSELVIGPVAVVAEFISALRHFSPMDMTFNGGGAEPKALHAEMDYSFKLGKHPSKIFLGYGHTWQALALNLPLQSYIAGFETSIWRDTIFAIEFRHDNDYGAGTTSTGGSVPFGPVTGPTGTGRCRNIITGELSVYF